MMRGPEAGAGCDVDGRSSGTAYSRDGAGSEESSPTAAMMATAGALTAQAGPSVAQSASPSALSKLLPRTLNRSATQSPLQ